MSLSHNVVVYSDVIEVSVYGAQGSWKVAAPREKTEQEMVDYVAEMIVLQGGPELEYGQKRQIRALIHQRLTLEVARSAETGKFVTEAEAQASPKTTVTQTVPRPAPKKKRK